MTRAKGKKRGNRDPRGDLDVIIFRERLRRLFGILLASRPKGHEK